MRIVDSDEASLAQRVEAALDRVRVVREEPR